MEHMVVRFKQGLPSSIRCMGKRGSFTIPKTKRMRVLDLMKRQPQHVLKKRKSSWEVVGIPPCMKQKGGNNYSKFLREIKKVLARVPDHALSTLPLVELQKHAAVKNLYERHFKNHPEFINPQSIVNAVASNLLNYDNTTGSVRESIADVRTKQQIPPSTVPWKSPEKTNSIDFSCCHWASF